MTVLSATKLLVTLAKEPDEDTVDLQIIEILGSAFIVKPEYEYEHYLGMVDFAIKRAAHTMSRRQRKAWAKTGYKRDEETVSAILGLSS